MVTRNIINQIFSQQPNSCVLSSYAIVTNYFRNGVQIPEIFDEYCNYFRIPFVTQINSEVFSGNHLNFICQNILHWRGYQMVEYLHNHSGHPLFRDNAQVFTANIVSLNRFQPAQYVNLRNELQNHESLCNILNIVNGGFHSRTLGIDLQRNQFIHNTDPNCNPKIQNVPNINNLDILECIVFRRI